MSINLYGEVITGAVDAIPCQEKRKFHVSFSIDSRDHLVSLLFVVTEADGHSSSSLRSPHPLPAAS